jgi:hypothetical protein
MFKWPDPPDGQIIVRLPFEIYWAASLSVTLILGFGTYIWSVREKPEEWRRTVKAIYWVGAEKLFALEAPMGDSQDEKPKQDSPSKGNAATTQAVPTNEETADNSQSAERKTESKSDIETGVVNVDTANQSARPSRCTVM